MKRFTYTRCFICSKKQKYGRKRCLSCKRNPAGWVRFKRKNIKKLYTGEIGMIYSCKFIPSGYV